MRSILWTLGVMLLKFQYNVDFSESHNFILFMAMLYLTLDIAVVIAKVRGGE